MSFNDTGSAIIKTNGTEFEFNNSYGVTRRHSIDKLINSTNKSYNIDEKLVISEFFSSSVIVMLGVQGLF